MLHFCCINAASGYETLYDDTLFPTLPVMIWTVVNFTICFLLGWALTEHNLYTFTFNLDSSWKVSCRIFGLPFHGSKNVWQYFRLEIDTTLCYGHVCHHGNEHYVWSNGHFIMRVTAREIVWSGLMCLTIHWLLVRKGVVSAMSGIHSCHTNPGPPM